MCIVRNRVPFDKKDILERWINEINNLMSRYDGFKGGIIMKNEEESLKEPLLTSTFVFENTAKMNKWIHSKDRP
eukprot:UN12975